MVFSTLLNRVLHEGLGPVARQDNPQLYLLVLGGLAFSVFLGIINFFISRVRFPRSEYSNVGILLDELRWLAFEVLAIYGIWLAYGTSYSQLPVIHISSSDQWFAVYTAGAVVVHGLLAVFAALFLAGSWQVQLNIRNVRSHLGGLVTLVSLGFIVFGWEMEYWPAAFVIPAEVLLLYFGAVGGLAMLLFTGMPIAREVNARNATRKQSQRAILDFAVLVGAFSIWFGHDIQAPWINVVGVYFVLATVDPFAASVASAFKRTVLAAAPFGRFNTPGRLLITVPLMLVLGLLGASGTFALVTRNSGITYMVWIEAATGAAAYMLFKPLTDLARLRILERDVNAILEKWSGEVQSQLPDQEDQAMSPPASDQKITEALRQITQQVAKEIEQARVFFERIAFPGFLIFLISIFLYNFLTSNFNLSALFLGVFASTGFSLAGLLRTMRTVYRWARTMKDLQPVVAKSLKAIIERIRPNIVILVYLLLLTILTAITVLLLSFLTTASDVSAAVDAAPFSLLTDMHFILATIHSMLQRLLLMLSIGQVLYYLLVVIAFLREGQNIPKGGK